MGQSLIQQVRSELTDALHAAGTPVSFPENASLDAIITAARGAKVSDAVIFRLIAGKMGIPFTETLSGYPTASDFVSSIPIAFARQHLVLGLAGSDGELIVAFGDPVRWEQLEIISRTLGKSVSPLLAPPGVIAAAIDEAYQQRTGQAQDFIGKLDRDDVMDELQTLAGREDLLDNASRAPVIKLVNLILFEAVKSNASDVHIQPYEDRLLVRTRIDGVLYDSFKLPKNIQEEVISRIKVMGRMNIAEKRLSQDGRATVEIGQRNIDLRIASLPTSYGERVVIRLLDKSTRLYSLPEIGMDAHTLARFGQLINIEHGLLLVTGPTGSGKSTTLYSALRQLNSKEKNILTLEDPIEYQLDGISQTQVSDKKGMTFASGLRSVLRQDPDIIMVGEIRDLETATMAIQSSLTGHLVFSTLHTNDAASAVTRLLDLGIEPYLVASSVVGVLAQRLVRRNCPDCSQPHVPDETELQWLGVDRSLTTRMRQGTGCPHCRETGYRGRLGTFELLILDQATRKLVAARATASELKDAALRNGTRTLRDDGIEKILAGITTIAEVERVTLEPEFTEAAVTATADA
jgi:general secretion pathway protein E